MAKKRSQKTWGGRFGRGPSELMQVFSESVSFDARLAPYDIACSKAHASMLAHVGIITAKECREICAGLNRIGRNVAKGKFKWDISLEDVHMNIEQALLKDVPAAAKLHTGRSRNDQVATDMRLFMKEAVALILQEIKLMSAALLDFAERGKSVYVPGYTHLQRAQPVSVAHHMLAYVEMLSRDAGRFSEVRERANECPLGSGAIAGTTLPIDRAYAAKLLGFVDAKGNACLTRNSMDAVSDRDLLMDFLHACSLTALHLSRLSEDMILWNSAEFGFVSLPDAYTTGSSLMPQKKNPDSFELIRGKCGRIVGDAYSLQLMVKGLPLTYNRDLQEDKPPVFDANDQLLLCLEVAAATVAGAELNAEACACAVEDPLLLATDVADYLVEKGLPFREAHHAVGKLVAISEKNGCRIDELSLKEAQGVSKLLTEDWTAVFDLKRAMKMREKPGMPGTKEVGKQIRFWKNKLSR